MTQEALAASSHLSRASIANIERGHHRIQLHILYEIAASLEVEPHDLLPHPAKARPSLPEDVKRQLKTTKEVQAVSRLVQEEADENG